MGDYTTTVTVDATPAEAFAAINDVRGWWSAEIEGGTEQLGDEFLFHIPEVHRCTMQLTEVTPGKRVVWHVSDAYLYFLEDKTEWTNTDVVFDITDMGDRTEIRFTHVGLVPGIECFDICSNAWGSYITGSLRDLITTGKGDPYTKGGTFESEALKHQR
ncbi:SRPBCC domain-containing protein [Nocardia sp. NPDC052566]|uniref:SRPBCC domain-containing protein n=1 Tax=Nocardia sp. NPDC052566 TaxID=3364330 RepID=UPI0037C8BA9D